MKATLFWIILATADAVVLWLAAFAGATAPAVVSSIGLLVSLVMGMASALRWYYGLDSPHEEP